MTGNDDLHYNQCTKRAIDGTRTRGLHLGKVALYQLSYYRIKELLCYLRKSTSKI